jgi:hypothetical protein
VLRTGASAECWEQETSERDTRAGRDRGNGPVHDSFLPEKLAAYAAGIVRVIATSREKHEEPQSSAILIGGDSGTRAGKGVYRTKARVYR